MGYLGNHLATVVCAIFAAVLTGLWYIMVPMFAVLDFVFIMAVPIMWFLVLACWIAQKSNDYTSKHSSHEEKKNHNSLTAARQIYTSDGKLVTTTELNEAKTQFGYDVNELRDALKLKDSEIENLNKKIENLETRVQIESLKSELADLKRLAVEESKRKTKRK